MYNEVYKLNYNFTTKRLIVKGWHSFKPQELHQRELVDIAQEILTPDVTNTFPLMWRGTYDKKRAKAWIQERDSESKTLLAIEKETNKAVGFINFFRVGDRSRGTNLRLGYMLSTSMWDKGFATELVQGFVCKCKENHVAAVLAGVDPANSASIRVLEKNNFITESTDANGIDLLFCYHLHCK